MLDTIPTITVPNIQPGMVLDFGGEPLGTDFYLGEAEVVSIFAPADSETAPYTLVVSPEDGSVSELTVPVNPWRSFAIVG